MSIIIRRGTHYLERVPYDGRWSWLAALSTYASRFRDDHVPTMIARLESAGVSGMVTEDDPRESNVTSAQVEAGAIEAPAVLV